MIQLDSSLDMPLYRQLYQHFTRLIQSGGMRAGERLPATRELAGTLGLNRTTIAAAYELLESEGWIYGEVGRGSFVRNRLENASGPFSWDDLLPRAAPWRPRPGPPGGALISFSTSRPSEQLFPLEAFRLSAQEVLDSPTMPGILQLGSPGGYEPLRQYLLEQARQEGTAGPNDDVIVTNGCQQALDLLCRVLVRPGDAVGMEDPVYPGLRNLFQEAHAGLFGARPGDVEALARKRPKVIVATPNFQNPTGETLGLDARESLLRAAGAVILENDIYGPLRYQGKALPTLKQLDGAGKVVLIRSFSKIAFPGLRVGWILAHRSLIQRLMEAKQLTDLHTDQFSQATLLQFEKTGRLSAHLKKVLLAGAERLHATLRACAEFLPAGSSFTRPQGGMSLWVELPGFLDAGALLTRAQAFGVTYLPGTRFSVARDHSHCLRLSFANLTTEKIERGISLLGHVCAEQMATDQMAAQPAEAIV